MSRVTDRLPGIDLGSVGLAIATVAAVIGIAGVFTGIDVSGLVQEQLQTILGLGSLLVGAVLARRWINAEPGGYEPHRPERVRPVSVPGDDLDELVRFRELASSAESIRFYRSQLREELQTVAIDVLRTHRGCSEAEVYEQLRNGTWTDDELAASVFRLDAGSGAGDEIASAFSRRGRSEHPATRRVRSAVEELARIAEGEP